LAIRSGFYKDIGVTEIKKGEYLGRDPETGKPRFKFIEDDEAREALPTVGYMAYFEYLNGFRKVIYWSKEKMVAHADTYSKAFSKDAVKSTYPNKCKVSFADYEAGNFPKEDAWKYSSPWYTSFDLMAMKTLVRQLISKWGIMSVDMQNAYDADSKAMDEQNGMFDSGEAAEEDFFGNSEGLDKPDVTDAEEKIVPKSARKRKTAEAETVDADPSNFFDDPNGQ
jgi:recombination protein RecT